MKKKILFLINTLRDGGAEKILVNIVNHLDPEKYDIEVRLIYTRGVYFGQLNKNIKLSYIAGKTGSFWAKLVSRLLPSLSSELLHHLFIKERYDVEVAFLEGYATKIVAGAPRGTKKLAWVHCDLCVDEWTNGVYRSSIEAQKCYDKFDQIVCVSEDVKKSLLKLYKLSNVMVLHNPIDSHSIRSKATEQLNIYYPKDKHILICMGRLVPNKYFMKLLRVMKNLCLKRDDAILWIIGDGQQRRELEQYVKDNKLNDYVVFWGFQENPYKFLSKSLLFVSPFEGEGLSTVVIESIILGVPVIAGECSGMAEILGTNSEYGLIVKNDIDILADTIDKLLTKKEELQILKDKAKLRSEDFGLDKAMKNIDNLLS